jgi:hypothetical protein
MFVVGTLKIVFANSSTPSPSWEDICAIFPPPLTVVPSKYFAFMVDIAPRAFDVAFEFEDKIYGQNLLEDYPIIRDCRYHNYHKMMTSSDLRALLEEENSEEDMSSFEEETTK